MPQGGAPKSFTFQHWAGVRPYTTSYDFAGSCVFSKQSPLSLCLAALKRRSSYRRYGANLPSSFDGVLSLALVYSTSPLVSGLVQFPMVTAGRAGFGFSGPTCGGAGAPVNRGGSSAITLPGVPYLLALLGLLRPQTAFAGARRG